MYDVTRMSAVGVNRPELLVGVTTPAARRAPFLDVLQDVVPAGRDATWTQPVVSSLGPPLVQRSFASSPLPRT